MGVEIRNSLKELFTFFFALFGIIPAIIFWNYWPPLNKSLETMRTINTEISRIDNDYQLKKNNIISSYNNIILNAKKSNKQINISDLQKDFNIISNDNDNSHTFATDYKNACDNVLQKIKQRVVKNVLKVNNNILNKIAADNKLEPITNKNDNKILQQSRKKFVEDRTNDNCDRLFWSMVVWFIVSAIFLIIGDHL